MSMPFEIAQVFDALRVEASWLHGRWICYRQLFAVSQERIDLLNEAAGTFFYIVEDVLYDEVQASLGKLTDPASSGVNKDNLSLEQLQLRIQKDDAQFATSCRSLLDALKLKCGVIQQWRHKKHAHFDLNVALKNTVLPGVSRQMIEEALEHVRAYLNEVELHYADSTTGYEHFVMPADGNALVSMLKFAMRYEELVQARKIDLGDWRQGKWHDA